MVARFVFLLFIFQYVLNAKALGLAFAQNPIMLGDDIVVSWSLDGANIQQFTLELRSPSNTLVKSQSVPTNGNDDDYVELSVQKMKPGHLYAQALASNLTVLGVSGQLTILDPNATSTSSNSSSSPSTTISLTTSSSPSTTSTPPSTSSTVTTSSDTVPTPEVKSPTRHNSTSPGTTTQTSTFSTAYVTTSGEPPPPTSVDAAPAASTNTKHSSLAVILGAVLGSVVGLGLLVCVTLMFLKRRRKAIRESAPSFFPARMIASVQSPHEEEVLRRMSQFKYGPDEEDETTRRLEDWKYGGAGRAEEDELYHFPVYLSATSRPEWREEAGLQ